MARTAARQGKKPQSVSTPDTRPSSRQIWEARACVTGIFSFFICKNRASMTSAARSDTGKTRLPRSTFSGTPRPVKKSSTHAGGVRVTAP